MTEILRATNIGFPVKARLQMILSDFSNMPGWVVHCTGFSWLVRHDPKDSRTQQVYYGQLAVSNCRRFALLVRL